MRIRSLRALIVGGLLVIHIVSTGLFLFVAGQFVRDDQRVFADSAMRATVDNISAHTLAFLDQLSRVALLTRGLAEAEVVRTERLAELERYFFEILEVNPEISGIYYGTVDGDFVFITRDAPGLGSEAAYFSRTMTGQPGGRRSIVRLRDAGFALVEARELGTADPFDPRERPWFTGAMAAEGVIWTQPYIFYTSGAAGISSGIKVLGKDGVPAGVIGADISLTALRDFARGLSVGRTGYAFLLGPNGRAISHPALPGDGSIPPLPLLSELGDPVLATLAGRQPAEEPVAGRLPAGDPATGRALAVAGPDGVENLVLAAPLPTEQGAWTIGAVVPEADLFGWVGALTRSIALLALGLTLFWCLVGLLLWRYIDRRLEKMRGLAEQVLARTPHRAGPAPAPGGFAELAETEAAVEGALQALDRQHRENLELLSQARTSDRAKSLFLASMSHELRTPLTAIGGFAEVIEHEILGPVGVAKYRDYAALIARANRGMLALVQNLLDASALESGRMELHAEEVDLDSLTMAVVEAQRPVAGTGGLALDVAAASGLTARVDGTKMRVLLGNLLQNALAYTPPGGRVSVALRRDAQGAPEFTVQDTGRGMDPARLDQLRQPFARGQRDSHLAGETGSGLGLSIVDRIAALHGARIAFDTAPGAGTRVTVTLPADCVVDAAPAAGGPA